MPAPATAASSPRKKPGPKTPEGKARSRMNALKHGLRAREFGLLAAESPVDWAEHLADLRAALGPVDGFEEKLVVGLAAAMWKEIRADRVECDVLSEIPARPGRGPGGELQEPRHAASLTTAIRYQTAAGMAVMRAQRALLAHRKAKKDGLAPDIARAVPVPPEPANQNHRPEPADGCAAEKFTNEFLPGTSEPEPPGAPGRVVSRTGGDALDDQAWVASLPVVEADPEREARRRELLLQVEPAILRRAIGHAPLAGIENYLLPDMAAYEEWFARQPKPPREAPASLSDTDRALVDHVTRHNPPWFKGEYLSYWRPPVPEELLGRPGTMPEAAEPAAAAPSPAATIATPLAELRARVARLLDPGAARRPDELDLAEAVCALTWPNWGPYGGSVDLELLRRALEGRKLDGRTLAWLDSHEFADACRAGTS